MNCSKTQSFRTSFPELWVDVFRTILKLWTITASQWASPWWGSPGVLLVLQSISTLTIRVAPLRGSTELNFLPLSCVWLEWRIVGIQSWLFFILESRMMWTVQFFSVLPLFLKKCGIDTWSVLPPYSLFFFVF